MSEIPYSLESEQGVLGCILLSPRDSLGELCARWGDSVDQFYDIRNRAVYVRALELYDRGDPVDLVSLCSALSGDDVDAAYVSSLGDKTPSAANLSYYADIVHEKWTLRKLLLVCQSVERKIIAGENEAKALLDEAERDVLGVVGADVSKDEKDSRALVHDVMETLEECFNRQGAISGLPTGYLDWDRMTGGMHPGEMVVLAARPGLGKTSLAMNIVDNVAVEGGKHVGVFSLEMTGQSLMNRLVCSRSRMDLARVRDGRFHESDFPKMSNAAGRLASAPIHIDDSSGLTILQLRAKARRWHHRYGLSLIVVDYLQLVSSPRRGDRREREVADISSGLKALSKELGVPVMVLSQLNRSVEGRDGPPRLSDLRESGSIEQDADAVALLSVDQNESAGINDGIPMVLNLAKQRNGPTGVVPLVFLRNYTRFESRAKGVE
jgi:replicative DNA helicase